MDRCLGQMDCILRMADAHGLCRDGRYRDGRWKDAQAHQASSGEQVGGQGEHSDTFSR